jgi:hypothetical protein
MMVVLDDLRAVLHDVGEPVRVGKGRYVLITADGYRLEVTPNVDPDLGPVYRGRMTVAEIAAEDLPSLPRVVEMLGETLGWGSYHPQVPFVKGWRVDAVEGGVLVLEHTSGVQVRYRLTLEAPL